MKDDCHIFSIYLHTIEKKSENKKQIIFIHLPGIKVRTIIQKTGHTEAFIIFPYTLQNRFIKTGVKLTYILTS